MSDTYTGGCLCGGVRYRATGPLRHVIACHCGQCRKTSGHFAAMTSVPLARFALHDITVGDSPVENPLNCVSE